MSKPGANLSTADRAKHADRKHTCPKCQRVIFGNGIVIHVARCGADYLERFMDKFVPEPNSGCWLWIGTVNPVTGYGTYWNGKTWAVAHRYSYQNLVGPIPDGLFIDRLCRVRCCVNPRHLEPVTHQENVRRGIEYKTKKRAAESDLREVYRALALLGAS